MTSRAAAATENTAGGETLFNPGMTTSELKEAAKQKGIKGYSSMKKAELLEVLNGG